MSEASAKRVVVVHQMGKVGSSAVCNALRQIPEVRTIFTHMMNRELLAAYVRRKRAAGLKVPTHARASSELWSLIREGDAPIDLISAVRDPMARNISAMFQNLPPEISLDPSEANVSVLIKRFLMQYPHSTAVRWFGRQLAEPLGIRVFDHPFERDRSRLFFECGRYRVLVLRAEDADEVKQRAVAESLNLPGLTLQRANVGAEKAYAALYRAFVQAFEPPEWLIEKCYRSETCLHFYSDEEIERFRARWSGRMRAEAAA